MDLSILIVTYNSARLVGPLMSALHDELAPLAAEVIVVDNASRDGTPDLLRRDHPWVKLDASDVNLGFAAGNNRAALQARGRWLLLLNPDALPEPGAIARGIALMRTHPEVGLGGGELRGTDGSRQPSARMFPTLRDELFTLSGLAARRPHSRLFARLDRRWADPEQAARVDWLPGAFVFVPRELFQSLGGFDERFFMYYEEVDLCRRLAASGHTVQYWPELKAMHIGGASARTVAKARVSRAGSQLEAWRMRSALLYYRKHHGGLAAWALQALERGWYGLRAFKARLTQRGSLREEFLTHVAQMREAWQETQGGRCSPQRPW
jgi:GT2 family glycosyltransferase